MDNPWAGVRDKDPFIALCDREPIDLVCSKDPSARSELHFEVLPEPYAGDPGTADVLLLSLNPGWGGTEQAEQTGADGWNQELRCNLTFAATTPFVHIDPRFRQTTGGGLWWSKRLRTLDDPTSWERVGERLMVLEFFDYHSKNRRLLPIPLPSQAFTFQLLREAMRQDRLIIATRGWSRWVWNVPELYAYKRIFHLKSKRWSGISAGNLEPDAFQQIVDALNSKP
jgi:hypothetical protein